MRALAYLLAMSLKNAFISALRKPSTLILYLSLTALVIGLAIFSVFTSGDADYMDMVYLKGIFFAFAFFFCGMSIAKGFSSGDTFFDMNDVNLLFVSPVGPRRILIYGIVRLAKMAFLASFFILFQSGSLGNGFGVGFGGLILLMLAFMLCVILSSIISVLIYSATNSKPRAKAAAKAVLMLLVVPLAAVFAFHYVETRDAVSSIMLLCGSDLLTWFPIIGWTAQGSMLIFGGDILYGLFFFGITILSGAGLIAYLALSRSDYYEDVLCATETAFEKRRAKESGDVNAAMSTSRRVKVAKTGISGAGAASLFGKHLRESFRQNRLGFFGFQSLLIVAGSLIAAYFMRGESIVVLLQILMWIQVFLIGTGRGLRELYTHYIFMIPESSFSKIVWSNMEIVFKTLIESLLIFGIGGVIMGENALIIIGAFLAYTMFSMLLLGINYVFMRLTGVNISAGFQVMIYVLATVISVAPGAAGAVILYSILSVVVGEITGLAVALSALACWELAVSLICFAVSRGVLHNCDMPTMPKKR